MQRNINLLNILKEEKEMRLSGRIYHRSQILFSYTSNKIEGCNLTEEQTRLIFEINSIYSEDSKPIKVDDVIETVNHFHAFDYILDIAEETLTEEIIKNIHKILKTGTSDSSKSWINIGEY